MTRTRIIVADDHIAFLKTVVSLLEVEFRILATANDGRSALDLIRRLEPDVAVLDLGMPVLNGLEVARMLMSTAPHLAIVMCSVETDPEIVQAATTAGALAYVRKARVAQDLKYAIRLAAKHCPFAPAHKFTALS